MANGIPKTTAGDATGEWQRKLLEQRTPLDPADPYNRVDPPRATVGGKKRSLDDMRRLSEVIKRAAPGAPSREAAVGEVDKNPARTPVGAVFQYIVRRSLSLLRTCRDLMS
jgi:hypothetical protein